MGGAQLSGGLLAPGSGEGSGGAWLGVRWKTSAAVTRSLMTLLFMQLKSGGSGEQTEPFWSLRREPAGTKQPFVVGSWTEGEEPKRSSLPVLSRSSVLSDFPVSARLGLLLCNSFKA